MKKALLLLGLCCSLVSTAQIDSALTLPLVGVHIGGQMPYGDLSKRFGADLETGGTFMLKTRRNWIVGLEANYFFGRNVKENVITQLTNSDGFMLDNEGYPADIRITERGLCLNLSGGRLFKLASANPNSGVVVTVGAGYIQHKIKLYDAQQKIAAFKGNLARGYDRLTAGFCLNQFVGYLFLSENRFTNFYAGFDFYEGFTSSVRKLNYDTGLADTGRRLDLLVGFRFGWVLPLYKKRPNDFYYN